MTYEQAGHGRAGLGVNTDEGYELTLVDRVAHHTTTALSTVEVSSINAQRLNTEFKKFFQNGNLKYKSYVLKGNQDNIDALTQLLRKHEIRYGFSSGGTVSGYSYTKNANGSMNSADALVVSTNQPKGKMVKALFEPNAKLEEPLTYDITAWSLPHAYGLEAIASAVDVSANRELPLYNIYNQPSASSPGYITSWNSLYDAEFLAELLRNDIRVRFTEKDVSYAGASFKKGSLIITRSDNRKISEFDLRVNDLATKHNRQLYASPTSYSDNGYDFGSPEIKLINKQRIAVLMGSGTSSLSYGAIWHFFEQQLHYPITSINTDNFSSRALSDFDVLILPSGWYGDVLNDSAMDDLKSWIRSGGKVIAFSNALRTFADKEGFSLSWNESDKDEEDESDKNLTPYDQRNRQRVSNFITGSIYQVTLDPTHPMAFGYGKNYFSLKMGGNSYSFLENGYNVGYIKGTPVSVSGFSGDNAKAGLENSLVFGEARMGRGSIIYLVDDVMFRSFWENGKLFLVNSVFFVNNNKFRI